MMLSMISEMTSDADEHFSTGDSRFCSQAGRSIMSVWHAQAATDSWQTAASRSADSVSCRTATARSMAVVARLSGHGGSQSAHASGLGKPPSRALKEKNSHFLTQSSTSLQVTGSSTLPLTCVSGTSVRGYSRLDSAMLTPATKSESVVSTSAPQKSCDQPVARPVHPMTLSVALAPPALSQPVLP